ncbi:MAG: hypothetical protein IJX90_02905 [Blautia sp.]|nr:hypothetical protein [Blautia sp.]
MKKKLTANIPLKIISLLLGILVWLIVANIDNPVIDKTYTIGNVDLINEAYIDDTGKVCLRDGGQTTVRVTITGESKTLRRITSDDVRLVADLQQAVSLETNPVMIPITPYVNGIAASSISVWPQNLSVRLEDKVTSEFMISVVNSGESKPGRGYEIGSQTASPEKVRITGPESLVNKIDKVTASVSVGGITTDTSVEANLTVIDKNADAFTETDLSNLRFDNGGKATVTTKLWKVRTDVGLQVEVSGEAAEGYMVDSITTVPETVSVAGTTEALAALKEQGNILQLQDEAIDISGASSDVEQKLTISPSLGDGLKLTSGSSDEVLVTVNILPDGGKAISISTADVTVNNKPEDMQVSFEVDKVDLRVQTGDEDPEALREKDISGSIDLEGMDEGTYEVPVDIKLPEGYELIGQVTTEVTVSKVSTAEESGR